MIGGPIGGLIIVILLVLVFIFTFVIPVAQGKNSNPEGFAINMPSYKADRLTMGAQGIQAYNPLAASLNPVLPNFGVANANISTDLTSSQYTQEFNTATSIANKQITAALQTPDDIPSGESPTNLGIAPQAVYPQLPPANDLYIKALKCQANVKGRNCNQLKDPQNALCGICMKSGTKYDGSSAGTFIGGLLSLVQDRNDAADAASSVGNPYPDYYPTLGKCAPGMFVVDQQSCEKVYNQLGCEEIGESGGFNGGKTSEGLTLDQLSCAQAPLSGDNVFVYHPQDRKFDVVIRVLTPFDSGITKIVVTHVESGQTYTADNSGIPGQEFSLKIKGVKEADKVQVLVAQEQPSRTGGEPEVFQVTEIDGTGKLATYTPELADKLCKRIGTSVASSAQLNAALSNGLQAPRCAFTSDAGPVYAAQSGAPSFTSIPIGGNPASAKCNAEKPENNSGVWCYGFKPAETPINPTDPPPIGTRIVNWFDKFVGAQPPQGTSLYSKFSSPGQPDPPGNSFRAVLIQWEMFNSTTRTIPFAQTISMVNNFPVSPPPPGGSPLRLYGPYSGSSVINAPAWTPTSGMVKNQFWFWSNIPRSQRAIFTAQVPGFLSDPFYRDDKYNAPVGPLISKKSTAALLQSSPCMASDQMPGKYSAACLLELYKGAGGIPGKGKLTITNGGLSQLNSYGDLNAIMTYLTGLYSTATRGKDATGTVISLNVATRIRAMNAAAQLLFGFDIVNACETIIDNADGSVGIVATPVNNITGECLQYLYLNAGSDVINTPMGSTLKATYTSVKDRFSGLLNTESTPDLRRKYPFQACSLNGTSAPIKNGKPDMNVIGQLMNMSSIVEIQNYFDKIHKTANNFAANYRSTEEEALAQAEAVQMCYGLNRNSKAATGFGCTNWVPTTIDNIAIWLDGADPFATGKEPENGTAVGVWRDKSGKQRHAQASNNSNNSTMCPNNGENYCNPPIYNTKVVKRKGSILLNPYQSIETSTRGSGFTGPTATYVLPAFDPAPASSATPGSPTIFIVVSSKTYTANNGAWLSTVVPWNWTWFFLNESVQGGGAGTINLTAGNVNERNILVPKGTANKAPQILSLSMCDPTNTTLPYYRSTVHVNGNLWRSARYGNGVPVQSISTATQVRGYMTGSAIQFVLGAGLSGYVHELIMYDRTLNEDERTKVEGYLAWKWGQQDSLPVDHPYSGGEPS